MDRSEAILATRIKAVNTVNDYANTLFEPLAETFKPLIGQQVFTISGEWIEKYKSKLPTFEKQWNGVAINVYRISSRYSLGWEVRACCHIAIGYGCIYEHASVYIAHIKGQVLSSMFDKPEPYKTDYTAEDIMAKRETYQRLKKLADDAQAALHPFGEYDR